MWMIKERKHPEQKANLCVSLYVNGRGSTWHCSWEHPPCGHRGVCVLGGICAGIYGCILEQACTHKPHLWLHRCWPAGELELLDFWNFWSHRKCTYVYMSLYYIVYTNLKYLCGKVIHGAVSARWLLSPGESYLLRAKKEEPSRLLELSVCFTTPGSFQEESIW